MIASIRLNMLALLLGCSFAGGLSSPIAAPVQAADVLVPRQHHSWGQFSKGAWRKTRVIQRNYDDAGNVISSRAIESTTTLADVNDLGVSLQINRVDELTGNRFEWQSRTIWQSYNGDIPGQTVAFQPTSTGTVSVQKQEIPTEIRQASITGDSQRRISTLHYSSKVAPYVLKRETSTTSADGKMSISRNEVEVVALDVPYKVLNVEKSTSQIRTVHRTLGTTMETTEHHCESVPGWVVAHSMKETDNRTGKLISTSTLELVDYSTRYASAGATTQHYSFMPVIEMQGTRRGGLTRREARRRGWPMMVSPPQELPMTGRLLGDRVEEQTPPTTILPAMISPVEETRKYSIPLLQPKQDGAQPTGTKPTGNQQTGHKTTGGVSSASFMLIPTAGTAENEPKIYPLEGPCVGAARGVASRIRARRGQ